MVVSGAKPKAKPHPVRRRAAAPTATPLAAVAPVNAAEVKSGEFDNARTNLYTTMGTTEDTMTHDTIQAPYAQFNVGASHEFAMPDNKPLTVRFDAVNLLDTIYQIRSGTGIGVFAPQYGPRRGFFVGVTKKI